MLTGSPVVPRKASCMRSLHQRHDCGRTASPETHTWLQALPQTRTASLHCQAGHQATPAWLVGTSDAWPQLALLMHSAQVAIPGDLSCIHAALQGEVRGPHAHPRAKLLCEPLADCRCPAVHPYYSVVQGLTCT